MAVFPLAAAMNFGYLFLLLLQNTRKKILLLLLLLAPRWKTPWKKITCRQENTMPLKDGRSKTPYSCKIAPRKCLT